MDTTPRKSLHPLIATAAVAVIILSAVGVAAITGLLPTSKSTSDPVASPLIQPAGAPQSTTATQQPAQPTKAAVPAPVKQAAPRPPEPVSPPQPIAAQPRREEPVQVAAAERSTPRPICVDCGTVEGVREIKQEGDGSGLGAVAGGVAGAVLGNQVGGGSGRTIATVVGAVGGAVAGHKVEKHVKSNMVYEITVRMDDGNVRTFSEANPPTWRAGDKVRVQGERLTTQG